MSVAGRAVPAVRFAGVCKRFGAVQANRDVSFEVARGSVHGIVGENGAGKSTLMSILYGFYQADSGRVEIDGEARRLRSSEEALAAGVGMVHQHFMLVENFTVLENVVLGAEGGALLRPALEAAATALEGLAQEYGLRVPVYAMCADLDVGARQRVEILKALYRGARILILDEPTGVLTPQEADQLFDVLRALAAQGVTVLLITHKLREILAVTDSVTVMRSGAVVGTRRTQDTDADDLAEMMVGRKVALKVARDAGVARAVALEASGLGVGSPKAGYALRDVSFTLHAGEILGIAGVAGNGQSELLEVLSGIRPVSTGEFSIGELRVSREHAAGPQMLRRAGLAHVPEDRLRTGLVAAFSAAESAVLGCHRERRFDGPRGRRCLWSLRAIREHCLACMRRFDVRPVDPDLRTAGFSGGNQQKLLLAREISGNPSVLLVGQPTRGVDIGAIQTIHEHLLALRDAGTAILLVSVELDEVLALSDRIMVMSGGHVAGVLSADEADELQLGRLMADVGAGQPGQAA